MGIKKEDTKEILAKAGIDAARRGETLSLAEFAAAADAYTVLVQRTDKPG